MVSHGHRTVAVGISLDHQHDLDSRSSAPTDHRKVVGDGVEIDLGPGSVVLHPGSLAFAHVRSNLLRSVTAGARVHLGGFERPDGARNRARIRERNTGFVHLALLTAPMRSAILSRA